MKLRLIGFSFLLLTLSITARATPITLTFDELPSQPVDGLTFQGVTFGFTIGGFPSTDATYNGGGTTGTFVQLPTLEGEASGILTLDFALPTNILQFGVALKCCGTLTPGFTVELFDPGLLSLGVTPVNTSPLGGPAPTEGQFTYSGPLVSRAVIDFEDSGVKFAFDNLTYEPIPEPTSLLLLGSGLAALAGIRKKKLSKKA